jgi:hypothetical protein
MEARRGGGAKEAQEWTEGRETSAKKIGRNYKKTKKNTGIDRKVNIAKHQNKIGMEKAGDEKKERGYRV